LVENLSYAICTQQENTPLFSFLSFKSDFLALRQEHELRILTLEDLLQKLSAEYKVFES